MKRFLGELIALTLLLGLLMNCRSSDEPLGYFEPKERATLKEERDHVFSLAFSPDSKMLACGGLGNERVQLWDLSTGKVRNTFKRNGNNVYSLAFSPDGKTLASASGDLRSAGEITVWDLATRKGRILAQDPADVFKSIAFSPDGRTLAAGCLVSSAIRLMDLATGKERGRYTVHDPRGISSIAFSPDGKLIASAGSDGMVKVWDVIRSKEVLSLRASSGGGHAPLTFSSNGKMLACGCNSYFRKNGGLGFLGEVKVWDVASGRESANFLGHTGNLRAVAFSPDGKILASGSMDQSVKLWDLATGKEQATLRAGVITCLAFSPDGAILAVGSTDGTLKVWDLAPPKHEGK